MAKTMQYEWPKIADFCQDKRGAIFKRGRIFKEDPADVRQMLVILHWELQASFDPTRGVPPEAFLMQKLDERLMQQQQFGKQFRRQTDSLDFLQEVGQEPRSRATEEIAGWRLLEESEIEAAVAQLTGNLRGAAQLALDGCDTNQIADRLRCSVRRAQQLIDDAADRLAALANGAAPAQLALFGEVSNG